MPTYISPTARSYGYKIGAAADWNVIVNDMKNHEDRLLILEAMGGVTTPTNVPLGGILLWSGAIGSIPAGFSLCNGATVGGIVTPDLRNKFVIGAGSTYAIGATGGATTHTHGGNGTGSGGSHNHSFSGNTGVPSSTQSTGGAGTSVASSGHSHSFSGSTGSGGSHSHSVSTSDAGSSLPPFYALAFIIRTT